MCCYVHLSILWAQKERKTSDGGGGGRGGDGDGEGRFPSSPFTIVAPLVVVDSIPTLAEGWDFKRLVPTTTGHSRNCAEQKQQRHREETHPDEAQRSRPGMVVRDLPPAPRMHNRALVHDTTDEVDDCKDAHSELR